MMTIVESTGTSSSADEVHRRWCAREAPDGDFIVFADGSLSVMDYLVICPADSHAGERRKWQEILRATAWTAAHWLDVDGVLASCSHAGSRAEAGESAAHGSIGWVALTHDDGTLEWIAISTDSNPFSKVSLDDTTVTATSTAGQIWAFPRDHPQQVTITQTRQMS